MLFLLLLLLSAVVPGSAQEDPPPRGCPSDLPRTYWALCSLEAVWGVVLEAAAGAGALGALLLAMVLLLYRLRRIDEPEQRSRVAPLLLLLPGVATLFGLTFAFLIEDGEPLCVVRRALWGPLFALCFSCLLVQAVRLWWPARGGSPRGRVSPRGAVLLGLAVALTLVQGIITAEWLLLTVVRLDLPACQYQPLDFGLSCTYVALLLLVALLASGCTLCRRGRRRRCEGVWLFLVCLTSALLWAAWLSFYLYGNEALGRSPNWDRPVLSVTLVAQGWLLLLLYAVPEAHACLSPLASASIPDYFDTSQSHPRMRDTSVYDVLPMQYMENQAFAFDEHNAALRSGGNPNGHLGIRSSAPFRSNIYQPTEMTVVLNGGTDAHSRCPSMNHSQPGTFHDSFWQRCPFGGYRSQLHPPTTQEGTCGEGRAGIQVSTSRSWGWGGTEPWTQEVDRQQGLFLDANKKPMHYFVSEKD
uniref:G protein-coupled receptor, class C, group 5, member Bb n=1 Tax=Paramormyrops kingsleyae TaxID=1676925 RepID=A0A3B3RHS3_9TELE|nr:G-protein coupled receptor family C group 5 member B-like isoform X1 [Paramormyrops kingsleyae]XP_023655656.1 G-protein coupled receptor family C group 5 member B-like isoform X1 [Paramormyrops kingsleyae]